jgi:tetratricopeptide (TPR) repeat protein
MIRNVLFGEQDESVATVLQYMGTLEFRSNELDRAFQLLDEFVRIRQENGTEPDGDFVNALFMIGNIHKMQGYEDEAKKCWKEAYGIFKELGLAQGNPQIAAVMRNLLDDEDFDRPEGGFVGFGNGPSVAGRNVFDMISEKVKSATRTASEAAAAMKNAAGMQTDRGNQLL